MLTKIWGENFRKHLDVTVNLTPGVNAFRAANEAGKSTIIEIMTYVMSGARGLKDPLEAVVTTGVPVNKLKAGITIVIDGVTYEAKRSKSGAEITFGDQIVTGQTECTKFFERLMGCSADMSSQLMIAEQSSLRGALEGGPTAAGKMIEDLANFDLIDTIVELVQTKLVSGSTAAAEARVNLATSQAAEIELIDLAPLVLNLANVELEANEADSILEAVKASCPSIEDTQQAQKTLADIDATLCQQTRLTGQVHQLEELVKVEIPSAPSEAEVLELREGIALAKEAVKLKAMKASLEKLDTSMQWEGNLDSLQAEKVATEAKLTLKRQQGLDAKILLTQLQGKLIKETSCAFCQKDLTDVPEVVQINSALAPQIKAQEVLIAALCEQASEASDYLDQLQAVLSASATLDAYYSRYADHITIDDSNVPATYTWVTEIKEAVDASADLAEAERKIKLRVTAEAKLAADQETLKRAKVDLGKLSAQVEALPSKVDAQAMLIKASEASSALEAANGIVKQATTKRFIAQAALDNARTANARAEAEQAKAKAALQDMITELASMNENNALIKKLRLARPQITDKLWTIVLAAVSTYFTQVRGFSSVVTRESNVFKVNGISVGGGGLSGSAKDALGLAIRIALVKMFLPNTSFMVLDEMAAACDDERETSMLGLIATAGFAQVILVTHSPLCDAFSDNIITL